MGKELRKLVFGILFVTLGIAGYSQTPGIRKIETKEKSSIYEIKVSDLSGPSAAIFLDMQMKEKQGIVSTATNELTKVCTLEVLEWVGEKELRIIVEGLGFTVAKLFE